SQHMLGRVAEAYLTDSQRLMEAIVRAIEAGEGAELARAAHAWRSCNGNVGASPLVRLCGELESCARAGDLETARGLLTQVHGLYARVSEELQHEAQRSA
ncbi:MAG: Hpt domain-containing protein, partial [Steroidobacteraceae bacterium]